MALKVSSDWIWKYGLSRLISHACADWSGPRSASSSMSPRKAAKLSDTSRTPCSLAHSTTSTMSRSLTPFGPTASRRIVSSERPAPALQGTKRWKAIGVPRSSRQTAITHSGSRPVSSPSSAMEKPRSRPPARWRSEMPTSARRSVGSSSPSRWISAVSAKFFVRLTAWRTGRMRRPSSVNSSTSMTASSPR